MPSTPIEALLDVNVVIASVFADHVMHGPARSFVQGLERFHTTPMTQGGFLRFATRPWKNERKEEQPPRLTIAEAQAKLREFTDAEGHGFLPDDAPFTDLGAALHAGTPAMDGCLLAPSGPPARIGAGLAGKPHGKLGRRGQASAFRGELMGCADPLAADTRSA
jgi:predicted nucleic acid-binding protein